MISLAVLEVFDLSYNFYASIVCRYLHSHMHLQKLNITLYIDIICFGVSAQIITKKMFIIDQLKRASGNTESRRGKRGDADQWQRSTTSPT